MKGPNPTAVYAASSMVAQGVVAVTYLVGARFSSPASFGFTVATVAIAAVLANVINFGSNTYLLRELSSRRVALVDFQGRLFVKVALSLAAGLVAGLLFLALGRGLDSLFSLTLLVPGLAASQMLIVPLLAGRNFVTAGLSVLADKISTFAVLMTLLSVGVDSSSGLLVALSCGPVVSSVLSLAGGPPEVRRLPTRGQLAAPWTGGRNFGIGSLAVSVQPLDVYALEILDSPQASGEYGAIKQWQQPFLTIASVFSRTRFPYWSSERNFPLAVANLQSYGKFLVIPVAACIGLALSSDFVVAFLLGEAYIQSASVLQVMCATIPLLMANQFLFPFLQAQGGEGFAAASLWTAVALQFVSLFVAGIAFGALGGAVGGLVGQLVLTVLCLLWIRSRLRTERAM